MRRIILAGSEWRLRALLRAQLIEEGFGVEAHATVASALASMSKAGTLPTLVVADLSESDRPSADLDALSNWTKRAPVWLLGSRATLPEDAAEHRGFEKVFFRPIDLAALVKAIQQRAGNPRE